MGIGLSELSALSGFGQGMSQSILKKHDLLDELEKERRKQAMAEQALRLRQAQTDIGSADIPISDKPLVVNAMGRSLEERMPEQAMVESILNPSTYDKQYGPWQPEQDTSAKRQALMESKIMGQKSTLTGELIAEKAKRQGKLGGGKTDEDLFDFSKVNPSLSGYKNSSGLEVGLQGVPEEDRKTIALNRLRQLEMKGKTFSYSDQNAFFKQLRLPPKWITDDKGSVKKVW